MSGIMMKALQLQVESLKRQVDQLGPENQRVRKLLTEFDQRHDTDQGTIEALAAQLADRDAALNAADDLAAAVAAWDWAVENEMGGENEATEMIQAKAAYSKARGQDA